MDDLWIIVASKVVFYGQIYQTLLLVNDSIVDAGPNTITKNTPSLNNKEAYDVSYGVI